MQDLSETAVAVPRGQHRNTALATWRRTRSVELRLQGMSYDDIAREVGYANRGTAHRVVKQALQLREVEAVETLRDLEYRRLEALHRALWGKAMSGDLKAGYALLRIAEARWRLLGLAREPEKRSVEPERPRTVVQRPDEGHTWGGGRV